MKRSYTKKQKQFIRNVTLIIAAICLLVELIGMIPGIPFNGWEDIGVALGLTAPAVIPEGELEVHFIDVHNADCILVRQGDKNLLIDAAERDNQDDILNYLQAQGIQKLDMVIATHPHADHIGSMAEIINQYSVGKFIMSFMPEEATPTSAVYTRMLEALDSHSVPVEEAVPGTVYELGTARLQIIAPLQEDDDPNDMSVVCRLTFGDRSFLFTGDAGKQVEKQLLQTSYTLKSDVLKLSHHGSTSGNSEAFLYEVEPTYAVITCGEGNSYGHPHEEVMDRLQRQNIQPLRADVYGSIVFTTDGTELSFKTEKE